MVFATKPSAYVFVVLRHIDSGKVMSSFNYLSSVAVMKYQLMVVFLVGCVSSIKPEVETSSQGLCNLCLSRKRTLELHSQGPIAAFSILL